MEELVRQVAAASSQVSCRLDEFGFSQVCNLKVFLCFVLLTLSCSEAMQSSAARRWPDVEAMFRLEFRIILSDVQGYFTRVLAERLPIAKENCITEALLIRPLEISV